MALEIVSEVKECTNCKEIMPLSAFYYRTARDKYYAFCKSCCANRKKNYLKAKPKEYKAITRKHNLKKKFNMTIEDYNKMFNEQNGCCKICGKHQQDEDRSLNVDHCHTTGKIRGLLCTKCNVTLGNVNDDISILEKAITYFKESI